MHMHKALPICSFRSILFFVSPPPSLSFFLCISLSLSFSLHLALSVRPSPKMPLPKCHCRGQAKFSGKAEVCFTVVPAGRGGGGEKAAFEVRGFEGQSLREVAAHGDSDGAKHLAELLEVRTTTTTTTTATAATATPYRESICGVGLFNGNALNECTMPPARPHLRSGCACPGMRHACWFFSPSHQ